MKTQAQMVAELQRWADLPCAFAESGDPTPCPKEWPEPHEREFWCAPCAARFVLEES